MLSQTAVAAPFDNMVTASVLNGWRSANGTYMMAVELTLQPGWKTYWRAPGDAGIPPVLNWAKSKNLAKAQITWPTPIVFDQDGMTSIGYKERVILPIAITPKNANKPVGLKLDMQIGVCREVCVPVQFSLNQKLLKHATKRDPKIAAALANRPFSAKEAGVKGVFCTLNPTKDGLSLRAEIKMPATGKHEFVVFEAGNPQIWASQAKVTRRGNILTATSELIHVEGSAFAFDRSAIRITVLGKTRSVDILGCS